MKFLVDHCAGTRLVGHLRKQGHDVRHALELGPDPGDEELLAQAAAEDRVLITNDRDFSALVYVLRRPHAGIILLPHVPFAERARLLDWLLADHSPALLARSVVSVRGHRIRISQPPATEDSEL